MCNGKSINEYAHACIAVLMSKPSCNGEGGGKCGRHAALCDAPECVAHRQCAVKALEEEGCMDSHAPAARRLRRVIDGAIKTCPTDSRPSKGVQAATGMATVVAAAVVVVQPIMRIRLRQCTSSTIM